MTVSLNLDRAEAVALLARMKSDPFPAPVEDFIEALTKAIDGDVALVKIEDGLGVCPRCGEDTPVFNFCAHCGLAIAPKENSA